jgi:hypothetical protein
MQDGFPARFLGRVSCSKLFAPFLLQRVAQVIERAATVQYGVADEQR